MNFKRRLVLIGNSGYGGEIKKSIFTALNYYLPKKEVTFIIDNPLPAITLNVDKQEGRYHIVAGAFRIEGNSFKKVKQLQKLGYNARKIGVNKYGLHEVVYESFEDRVEALRALRKIRYNHNKAAWLLIKELN